MTGVQAYLTMTGGSFDTDLVTERIGLAPDILKRREAGPHGEVSTEWGIRTELEISHNDEKAVHWIEREHRTLQLI